MKPKDILLVVLQFILFILFISVPSGIAATFFLQLVAFLLTVSGIIIVAIALMNLGNNLTPFPTPKKDGTLITSGIYKWIRHPVYTGILLSVFGIALYSLNLPRLIIFMLLCFLFFYKARYEETLLKDQFPEYPNYAGKAGMFLPKFF